ncbi:hypothetical protein [Lunatimonas salinarum]|uniref:hypothetical protein n=1 Tax=Lunatimonas salinarum TaxID=1774590 RepID=UPI001AE06919|nr:hypothetical protein [Lunatimonas salinarum]
MKTGTLEKTAEAALDKIKELKLDEGLMKDLEWCLGSYRYDGVPSGLTEKCQEALYILKEVKEKKPRSVTKKLIESLEAL